MYLYHVFFFHARRYLDTGEIDFYNHAELCTGRCKSKMGNKTATPVNINDTLSSPSLGKKGAGNGLKPSVYFDNDQYSSNVSKAPYFWFKTCTNFHADR